MGRHANAGSLGQKSIGQKLAKCHFDQAQRESKHRCRFVHAESIGDAEPDPTLRAIRQAWLAVGARSFFAPTEAEARLRLFGDPSE